MNTITRYLTSRTDRSQYKRGNLTRNISLQVGIMGMILTLLLAVRLVTTRQDAFVMQQADRQIRPYQLVQSHGKGGTNHTVLKFYHSNTQKELGSVQGRIVNDCANRRGELAFSVEGDNRVRSYLVANGKRTAIIVPGARDVRVRKINERGDVLGMLSRSDQRWNRLIWRGFVLSQGRLFELDTFGGPNCFVNDINEEGIVVGKADTVEGDHHAFQWRVGQPMQDLGTLPRGQNSEAVAINGKREIVGSGDVDRENRHALLWRHGTLLDLNRMTLHRNGWELQEGCELNDQGEILVFATKDHLTGYFRLKAQNAVSAPANGL